MPKYPYNSVCLDTPDREAERAAQATCKGSHAGHYTRQVPPPCAKNNQQCKDQPC